MTSNIAASPQSSLYFEDVQVGDSLPPLVKPPVTLNNLVRYAGASGDFNPLHTDPKFGENLGTGGIIAHGMFVMGFLGQLVSDYVGPTALRHFDVRFKGMTHIDDVLTCTGTVTGKSEEANEARISGNIQVADQKGEVKAVGTFTAALPRRS